MKRILAFAVVAVLAACTQEPPAVAVPPENFRDQDAQIASQTNVTAERMAADWVIRQRFAAPRTPLTRLTLDSLPNGALQMSVLNGDCSDDLCVEEDVLILLDKTGPGRWTARGPQNELPDGELWVMWMDFDSRTAAIGTPSGEFGWIMDKNLTGGRDRITAARDIMVWFGYDVAKLQEGES